jgi:hypothetical protein
VHVGAVAIPANWYPLLHWHAYAPCVSVHVPAPHGFVPLVHSFLFTHVPFRNSYPAPHVQPYEPVVFEHVPTLDVDPQIVAFAVHSSTSVHVTPSPP